VSEGIEPIYADLPSAVHSKENVLYRAGQELLSLPTGEARIAYVGEGGRIAGSLKVPKVRSRVAADKEFEALRAKMLMASASALPIREAIKTIEQREQRLIAEARKAKAPPSIPKEPKTYRVPAPKQRTRR